MMTADIVVALLVVAVIVLNAARSKRRANVERYLFGEILRDIAIAQNKLAVSDREIVATYVLKHMTAEDKLIRDVKREKKKIVETSRMIAERAKADRHAALASGASTFSDPDWCGASLVEVWATARLYAAERTISEAAFEMIDKAVWTFISRTLTPEEMDGLIG
jgi:hypothetical protein